MLCFKILYCASKYFVKCVKMCVKILYCASNALLCVKILYSASKYFIVRHDIKLCFKILYSASKYFVKCVKILYCASKCLNVLHQLAQNLSRVEGMSHRKIISLGNIRKDFDPPYFYLCEENIAYPPNQTKFSCLLNYPVCIS